MAENGDDQLPPGVPQPAVAGTAKQRVDVPPPEITMAAGDLQTARAADFARLAELRYDGYKKIVVKNLESIHNTKCSMGT